MRCIDMIGQRFGKLVVVSRAENDKKGQARWLCQCDCGGSTITTRYNLITRQTKSCGCILRSPRTTELDKKLKGVLGNMKARCNNPKHTHYKYYGGRGITVCEEWQHVDKFREWAYNNGYKPGLTIDRIDVNGNYEPSNCRWVTMQEQNYNRTDNHLLTYKGETKCLAEWESQLGIDHRTILIRLNNGWTVEQALSTPINNHLTKISYNNQTHTLAEWATITNINVGTLHSRLKILHWSIEKALTTPVRKLNRKKN